MKMHRFMVLYSRNIILTILNILFIIGILMANKISFIADNAYVLLAIRIALIVTVIINIYIFIKVRDFKKKLNDPLLQARFDYETELTYLGHKDTFDILVGKFPSLNTPLDLNDGERAGFYCEAKRLIIKDKLTSYKLGKRIEGYPLNIDEEIKKDEAIYYDGQLIITNKRIVFLNDDHGLEININNIRKYYRRGNILFIKTKDTTYTLLVPKICLLTDTLNLATSKKSKYNSNK